MKAGAKAMSKGTLLKTIATEQGFFASDEQLRGHCHQGGEKDRRVRNPRLVPHQDSDEASHKGRSEDNVWQGDEGGRKASQDRREGLCGSSLEEADLEWRIAFLLRAFSEAWLPWESHSAGLRWALS